MRWSVALLGCALVAQQVDAEAKRAKFAAEVARVYGFRVEDLKREDQEQKSKDMEAFEKMVTDDRGALLPLLREHMRADSATTIFRFDAAQILAELSEGEQDLQLSADTLAKVDVKGLSRPVYFGWAHNLAVQGANVTGAVERMLDADTFTVFLPDHVITLSKDTCCSYCMMAMAKEDWIDAWCKRLAREKDRDKVIVILVCLRDTFTDRAKEAILAFAKSTKDTELANVAKRCAEFQKQQDLPALTLTAERDKLFPFLEAYLQRDYEDFDVKLYEAQAPYLVVHADYAKLKELRRKQAARVSDEALHEIELLSQLIELAYTAPK
ncbi:MAG: hypothetical protein ABL997_08575 [Planctomycetota bacterium]